MTASLDLFVPASARGRDRCQPRPTQLSRAAGLRPGRLVGPGRRRLGTPASCLGLGALPPEWRILPERRVRLTRRGQAAVTLSGMVAGCLLGVAAWISAPDVPRAGGPAASAVVVHDGETLWSISNRVAPASDPRHEVAILMRLNGLTDATVFPGQTLRVR
jgi:hypothetical protein